jgi:hypothetical protein
MRRQRAPFHTDNRALRLAAGTAFSRFQPVRDAANVGIDASD